MIPPIDRILLILCLRWLLLERAALPRVALMIRAVRTIDLDAAVRANHDDSTNAEAAMRIWRTANSGLFPPPLLIHAGKEHVSQGCSHLMTHQADVSSTASNTPCYCRFKCRGP